MFPTQHIHATPVKRNSIVTVLSCIVALVCTMFSCSENDLNLKQNVLVINGKSFAVKQLFTTTGSVMQDDAGADGTRFTVALATDGIKYENPDFNGAGSILYLQLASRTSTTLLDGVYTYQPEDVFFPVLLSGNLSVIENPDGVTGSVSSGSVLISKSGGTYTLTFNLLITSGAVEHIVSGYYTGSTTSFVLPG